MTNGRLQGIFGFTVMVAVATTTLIGSARQGTSPEALLGKALHQEEIEGNLEAAIATYKQVLANPHASRLVMAGALLHLGASYEKLGQSGAREAYEQIVAKYPDSGAVFTTARARLARLQAAAAGPFKSRSLDAMIKGDYERLSVSPSGAMVAYWRSSAARAEGQATREVLCVRDLGSGTERILVDLTNKDQHVGGPLTWSPDNQRISYAVTIGSSRELRFVTIDRGESRTYETIDVKAVGGGSSWSPDGQRLAFAVKRTPADPYEIRLVTMGATDVRSLILGTSRAVQMTVVWSPDGKQIAFPAPDLDKRAEEIGVVTVQTGARRQLGMPSPAPGGRTAVFDWTPRDEIAISQSVPGLGYDNFLVPASGGTPRKTCEGRGHSGGDGCQATFSPDGTLQIIRKNLSGGGRTVLRDTVTGAERPLTLSSVFENPDGVGFSRDGRLLGFRSHRDGKWGLYVVPVDRIPVENPVQIVELESSGSFVSGTWTLAGLVLQISQEEENLYRVDVDPKSGRPVGVVHRLTQESPTNVLPKVSPDGQRIAYISRSAVRSGVAVMDANGAHERVLIDVPPTVPLGIQPLGWRSGEEILLGEPTPREGRQPGIETLNIRTGELKGLLPLPTDFMRGGSGVPGLFSYISETREFFYQSAGKRLRSTSGIEVAGLSNDWTSAEFSPDGRFLIYATRHADEPGRDKSFSVDLRFKPLSGGPERVLAQHMSDPTKGDGEIVPKAVSGDGRFLLYSDFNRTLRVMNVETAESWPLLDERQGAVSFEDSNAHWSPDGSFIVLDGSTDRDEWRAFDGVTHDAVMTLMNGRGRQ